MIVTRLGMYREAEAQFKSALKHFSTVDMFLYLCKVYVKLDQPNNALDFFKKVRLAWAMGLLTVCTVNTACDGFHKLDIYTMYVQCTRYIRACMIMYMCMYEHVYVHV